MYLILSPNPEFPTHLETEQLLKSKEFLPLDKSFFACFLLQKYPDTLLLLKIQISKPQEDK